MADSKRENVSITLSDDQPDPPACLWCVVDPASPEHYPYCSLDCATASAIDEERGM